MATNAQLEARIRALETWKARVDIRLNILETAAPADLIVLEERVSTLEDKTCPQQDVLDNMEARLAVLDGDHVPTP